MTVTIIEATFEDTIFSAEVDGKDVDAVLARYRRGDGCERREGGRDTGERADAPEHR